ncbi:acyl carrier protein [compost metagenome]
MVVNERILNCLEESGIEVLEDGILDNIDSYAFISAIVSIEEAFDIEFPDEYLLIDKLSNIEDICLIVKQMLDNNEEE